MNKEKYLKLIMKNLKCSHKEKQRVLSDLKSDIENALENGESFEDIQKRLGTPYQLADELNENLTPVKKSKKKLIIIILLCICIIFVVGYFLIKSLMPETMTIEESKIFHETELLQESEKVIINITKDDKTDLYQMFDDKMKTTDSKKFDQAIKEIGELGQYQKITQSRFVCVKQKELIAVGEVVALYDHRSVTYTISFNENMQVIGIYMK